jgi:hypothetical protein
MKGSFSGLITFLVIRGIVLNQEVVIHAEAMIEPPLVRRIRIEHSGFRAAVLRSP